MYLEHFKELLNEVSGQSESTLIILFMGGLKLDLRGELNIAKPTSLQKAFELARIYESQRGSGMKFFAPWAEPIIKIPLASRKGVPIVRKTLTMEEWKERMAKGMCLNCDETYSPSHKCKG